MKKSGKTTIPDISEFIDESGKKWVQTSTDDLFSVQELNEILTTMEKDREEDSVLLARIDFQNVNREYYEAALALQTKLQKQTELLKKVITDSAIKIERKNKKLKELIGYIKKLHVLLAYMNANKDDIEKIKLPTDDLLRKAMADEAPIETEPSVYADVEEEELTFD